MKNSSSLPLSDQEIKKALTEFKSIAVVGLSPEPTRPSFGVTRYLIAAGYEILGVRPGSQEILGRPCFPDLASVTTKVDIVDVFRAPEHVPAIVDEAIKIGAKMIWLQEGVSHPQAEKKASDAGLLVVSDRCLLKEHRRLISM